MSILKNVAFMVGMAGAIGMAGAAAPDSVGDAGDGTPASHASRLTSSLSASYALADIVDLPAGTKRNPTPRGLPDRIARDALSALPRIDPSIPMRDGRISSLNRTFDGLVLRSLSDRAAGSNPPRVLFSTERMPKPSGWALLLSGLAVAGFMARRRRRPSAD
jgi:MYXO-CTERM domain-containing protein